MDVAPDTDAAVAWLRAWSADGPWTVLEIDPAVPNPQVRGFTTSDADALRSHVAERNGRLNLYFLPNRAAPHVTPGPRGYQTTPRKDHVTGIACVFVDLDLPADQPQTDANFDALLGRIRALDPAPTATVYSGGGFQAFWLFDVPLDPAVAMERAEAAGQAVARELRSDAVQNVNRLMRLPGTVNVPDAKKRERKGRVPALARVVECDWSRRWSLDDPVPHLPEGYWDPTDAPRRAGHSAGDLSERWRRLVRTGDAREYGDDRSRLVIAAARYLVAHGWSDDDIVALLTDRANGLSAHVLAQGNPLSYARRQAERARARHAADWDRDPRTGAILGASPANIRRAADEMGYRFRYNVFRDVTMVNGATPVEVQLENHHFSELRVAIHDRFKFRASREDLADTVSVVGRASTYHPVLDYLASLTWDGVPRIDRWLTTHCRVPDSAYARASGRLLLLAAVRRVRRPGCVFDEMVVLMSPRQGTGKSGAVRALVPDPDWYTDALPLRAPDQKVVEQLRGKWVVEFSELNGIAHADVEHMKSFLSRTTDSSRPAYGHVREDVPRQCVFVGTTNSDAFLRDVYNRRFWPHRVASEIDEAAVRRDRDQLWAEAAAAPADEPVRLDRSLWAEAAEHQEEFRYGDAWVDALADYLIHHPTLGEVTGRLSTPDVLRLIGKPNGMLGPTDNGRLTTCMRELGWERRLTRAGTGSTPLRGFAKGAETRRVCVTRDPVGDRLSVYYDPPPEDDASAGWADDPPPF